MSNQDVHCIDGGNMKIDPFLCRECKNNDRCIYIRNGKIFDEMPKEIGEWLLLICFT